MKLYDIAQENLRILEIIDEMEGEMTPELEKEFNEIMKAGDDKIRAVYHVYRNFEAQVPGIEAELKRLTAIKKSIESNKERIKNMLEVFMKATGRDRIESEEMKIILSKKVTFEYSEFPKEFVETVTTEKERLGDFKNWAKDNPETAEQLYGAKFIEGKAIQVK
ncbi:MAG: siphovirus Gp157 family protein [Saprospiraceae bacterium]